MDHKDRMRTENAVTDILLKCRNHNNGELTPECEEQCTLYCVCKSTVLHLKYPAKFIE